MIYDGVRREEIAEEARKKQAYLRNQEELREQLELTKAERLHRAFIHSHFIKEALEETDSPAWRVALERKSEREQRKARFYQQLLAHQAKQQVCLYLAVFLTSLRDLNGESECDLSALGRAHVQLAADGEGRPGRVRGTLLARLCL